MKEKIAEFIKDKLLTPVIYMSTEEDMVLVFGFFDTSIPEETIYFLQDELSKKIKEQVRIIDFRALDAFERYDVVSHAELIYKESDFVRSMFESAMAQDFSAELGERDALLRRVNKYGTPSVS